MQLTPLVLTQRTPDLRFIQSRKGYSLFTDSIELREKLVYTLVTAGLAVLAEDNGELLITYANLIKFAEFGDTFANWAIENNLYVDYDCDH